MPPHSHITHVQIHMPAENCDSTPHIRGRGCIRLHLRPAPTALPRLLREYHHAGETPLPPSLLPLVPPFLPPSGPCIPLRGTSREFSVSFPAKHMLRKSCEIDSILLASFPPSLPPSLLSPSLPPVSLYPHHAFRKGEHAGQGPRIHGG